MEMEGRAGGSLPFVGMIMVVLVQASSMVVAKMAMSDGLNKYTLAFYCNALSSLVLLPCPFIISRRSGSCPPLTFSVLRKIFLLSLVGSVGQICGYAGIDYSSPVLGTAMMNLIPAFTFILAVISRMEKLNWKGSSSQAKLVGTVASILGALVITLYKGPTILRLPSLPSFVHSRHLVSLLSRQLNWVLGGFLLAAEAFFLSLWFIMQAFILKDYPVVLNIMFYLMFFATIFSGLLSFIMVREPQSWTLKLDVGLIAILYSSLVAGVFRVTLCTWCLKKTGPVFVSMFKPLGIVFAVGLGFIFLGEKLHLGSLIGAAVIAMGFYAVMWGKSREEEKIIEDSGGADGSLASSSQKIPLLQSKSLSA
ncbi:WAT1-related protein At4g15540 isoform X1 [Eucalyptus grandis]|uniref:WAT1-related protein At4g15540 isoform X1 n=1 Tax=Eucalyptus grandis TaxID=71139 RepID=UPI00192E9664|nr:WAT1-related protein At4g15540 isoform X1 [Eucalyptus grandis]XP_039161829.1 WAT1-related protein At4g15540 isoform X1 [Eucalyptus grandis]